MKITSLTLSQCVRRYVAVVAVAGVVTAGACASAASVSNEQEAQIGAQEAAEINSQLPLVNDASLNNYINQLGSQIASHGQRGIPYRFYIVNSKQVNAFAVPGGYVYVNRGLIELTSNASELVGVLGHEISHVELRHSIEQMASAQNTNTAFGLASILLGRTSQTTQQVLGTAANIGATAYFAKFSRQDESEADANAIPLMIASGYNPAGLTTMFQKLLQEQQRNPSVVEGWFSTHPTTEARISATSSAINQIPASQRRNLTTDTNAFESFRSRMRSYRPAATQ